MNSITENIISKLKNIKIITFPAISSFDYIFHFSPNLNLFTQKIIIFNNRIFETAYRKKENIKFDTTSHTFIFGIENFKSEKYIMNLFIKLYKTYYHNKHPLFLFHVSDSANAKNIIKKITIKELTYNISNSLMQTLYIPPIKTQQ